MKPIIVLVFCCLAILTIQQTVSLNFAPKADAYYRLTTQWQGTGKSLDVVVDGTNKFLQLYNTGAYSGQYWKFTSLGNGYYRITNAWQGDGKSIDIINDGINNKLQLANTGSYTGQYWKHPCQTIRFLSNRIKD